MELEAINKNEQEIDMNISVFGKDNQLNFKIYYWNDRQGMAENTLPVVF